MQKLVEIPSDIAYLLIVLTLGVQMIRRSRSNRQALWFGAMTILLGAGDAFHLVPRVYGLCTTGLDSLAAPLGFGKLVTSITMTIFYVLLYQIWRMRYHVTGQKGLSTVVYILAAVRIALCLCPQNQWLSSTPPLSWGIYRNVPFALLGLVIIVLFYQAARTHHDHIFRWMWLAILLSFGFYIPVVLWADTIPLMGMLMLPKTCAYVWAVSMGYRAYALSQSQS